MVVPVQGGVAQAFATVTLLKYNVPFTLAGNVDWSDHQDWSGSHGAATFLPIRFVSALVAISSYFGVPRLCGCAVVADVGEMDFIGEGFVDFEVEDGGFAGWPVRS